MPLGNESLRFVAVFTPLLPMLSDTASACGRSIKDVGRCISIPDADRDDHGKYQEVPSGMDSDGNRGVPEFGGVYTPATIEEIGNGLRVACVVGCAY